MTGVQEYLPRSFLYLACVLLQAYNCSALSEMRYVSGAKALCFGCKSVMFQVEMRCVSGGYGPAKAVSAQLERCQIFPYFSYF